MKRLLCLIASIASLAGCATTTTSTPSDVPGSNPPPGKNDSSALATFVDMEFDGAILVDHEFAVESAIEQQMLYTIGHLNGDNSVGRLDNVKITELRTEPEGDRFRATFRVKLLVAWGDRENVPESYDVVLPIEGTADGLAAFTERYKEDCVDWAAHDVTVDSMWYYYRPRANGCELAEADVVRSQATVTPSAVESDGKYPEYDKIWEDGVLRVVSIFGKFEHGATDSSDLGINSFNEFTQLARAALGNRELTIEPEDAGDEPGIDNPDVTIRADLGGGRSVEFVTLLVDGVRTADDAFYQRYNALSGRADFISYTGHSGLGANIRELARRGTWIQGQYVIVMMNGCDTYAYVDGAIARAHIEQNPDDPEGTKYFDLVMNAMPSPALTGAYPAMAFVEAFLAEDARTYQQIFRQIDESQVVLVAGEADNTYSPYDPALTPDAEWSGMNESVELGREAVVRSTPLLPEGRYRVRLAGQSPELAVRLGPSANFEVVDCETRFQSGDATCEVRTSQPAMIHVRASAFTAGAGTLSIERI